MPRKTRKEKTIVKLRRELKSAKGYSKTKNRAQPANISSSEKSAIAPAYIIGDFKKTLALSALAISLELMLYWVL